MHEILEQYNENRKLQILLLEYSDTDFMLICQFLEDLAIPFQLRRVTEKEGYTQAIMKGSHEIILAEYDLPSLKGLEALKLKQRYCPDIPFLFITRFSGAERAAETIREGATDFLLKDNLVRLNSSILSSLREAYKRKRRGEADLALRRSEAKYRQLLEQAADGIFIADKDLHYLGVNSKACEMLEFTEEEILKMSLQDTLPAEIASPATVLKEMKVGETYRYESLRKKKDGAVFPVEMSVSKISGDCYQGIMRDISQRKMAQQALEEMIKKFEFYLSNAPLAVMEIDDAGKITRWSGQAEKIFGWNKEEVAGKHIRELALFHPDEREEVRIAFQKNIDAGIKNYTFPVRCYTKKGKMIYCETYHAISYDEQGGFHSLLSLVKDVTVPKLEALARRKWREEERKRVAREIHEGIGQLLAASKFKAASIDMAGPDAEEKIFEVEDLLGKAIEEVRRISLNMAPRSVEELGIEKAIRLLAQQIENMTGLQVSFLYIGSASQAGNQILATIYHIVQEALNNVVRHSHAFRVMVELKQSNEMVELLVRDNGLGFAADEVDLNYYSGLRDIRDRVRLLKGNFHLTSKPQKGTQLKVCVPL